MARAEQEELALSYLDEVHAYARRLTRSAWEAEDLVQATFERALRRSHGLRNPSRMRAWLFRIARNIHIDKIRSVSRRAEIRLRTTSRAVHPDPEASCPPKVSSA